MGSEKLQVPHPYVNSVRRLASAFLSFVGTNIGLITRPYEAVRKTVREGDVWELLYVAGVLFVYFALVGIIKTSLFRPFLLTRHVVALSVVVATTTILVSSTVYGVGRFLGGIGTYMKFLLAWAYTLIPTVCWFYATSILYVVIPPPRTTRPVGLLFSGLFLLFSVVMLFWKIILVYLTARFGLRLSLGRICILACVAGPVIALYSVAMYRLGIFRVPFI